MPPKTPEQLREQIEKQNEQPAKEGHERTAEGRSVETPTRGAFFKNLAKLSKPEKDD